MSQRSTPVTKNAPSSLPFDADHSTAEIKRRSVRGAGATVAGQATKFALQLVSTGILARLLTPADYGLVAMTAVITGFVGMFKEAGLSSATVQSRNLTHEQVSALFWINAALGAGITLLLMALSPAVAWFYGDDRLTAVTCGLAVSFVFGGLTVQHQALLRRAMRFSVLAVLDIMTMAMGILVATAMAFLGYRYWSLVGMSVAAAMTNAAGVWIAAKWRPRLPQRGTNIRPLIRFGTDILTFNFVNYFARQADTLLIGWRWGAEPLGLYDKAYRLLLMPIRQINSPIGTVASPALARLAARPDEFRRFFCGILQLMTSLTIPLVVGLAVFAQDVVLVWLGRDWLPCAHLFQLLAPAAMASAIGNTTGWLMISVGQTRKYKWMGVVLSVIAVAAFVVGLPYGASGVAIAYSSVALCYTVPVWIVTVRGTPVGIADIGRAVWPGFASVVPAAGAAWVLRNLELQSVPSMVMTVAAAGAYIGIYAGLLLVVFSRWRLFWRLAAQLRPPPNVAAG